MTVYDHDDSIAHTLRIDPSTGMQIVYDRNRPGFINLDPVAVRLTDVTAKPLGWVWPGWIPAGMLTILGGHVGDGKSTVIAALVAALTSGNPLPDGTTVEPLNVLILGHEDDPARVLRPRLDANHADPERVFLVDPTIRTRRDLHTDAWWLRDIIRENEIGLVVIDPLGDVLRRSDRASEGDIRAELEPLMKVIDATGVAVVGVMRVGKGGSVRRPAQSLVGSSAIPAIARSVIMIAPVTIPDTADRVILQVVKSNTGKPPQPVALEIASTGEVTWLGPVEEGIDEQLGDPRLGTTERREAARLLKDLLGGGPMPAKLMLRQARNVGFSEITIRRAKKDLGIKSVREPRTDGKWRWCLPGDEDKVRYAFEMDNLDLETVEELEDWLDIILGDMREIEFEYNLESLANTGIDWLSIPEEELLELLRKSVEDPALTPEGTVNTEVEEVAGDEPDIA